MKILHISDLHFQSEYPVSRWPSLGWRRIAAQTEFRLLGRGKLFERVAETVRTLLAEATRHGAEHLIVSGDLTALALPEEFEAARAALSAWGSRMTIIPGNHDRYTPQAARDQLFEKAFGDILCSDMPEHCREGVFPIVKLVGKDVAIVGLSSARVPLMPGIAAGWVGETQREALAAILGDPRVEGRAVILTVHHAPLRPSGRPDVTSHGLLDAPKVLQIAAAAGALALCHGHIHHRYRVAGPGRLSIFGAGSSTQTGIEGYWLLDVDRSGLKSAEAFHLPSLGEERQIPPVSR